jgi:protein SMG7
MTDTGRTDNDDPVGDAFRTVLNAEEHSEGDELDDELEVVVYPRYDGELFYFYASDVFFRTSTSPPGVPFCLPTTPVLAPGVTNGNLTSPNASTVTSPGRAVPGSSPAFTGTTAETLLKSFYNVGGDTPRSPRRQSVAPPSQFLFGSGPSNAPPSIWSTTLDQNPNLSPRTTSVTNQSLPGYGVEHNLLIPSSRGIHPSNQPPTMSPFAHSPPTLSTSFESTHDATNIHIDYPASRSFGPAYHRSISHSANTIQNSPSYQTAYNVASHRPFAYPHEQLYTEIAPTTFPPETAMHFQQGAFNPYPAAVSSPPQQYSRPIQHYPTSSVWENVG